MMRTIKQRVCEWILILFYGVVVLYTVAEFPYKPLVVIYEGF